MYVCLLRVVAGVCVRVRACTRTHVCIYLSVVNAFVCLQTTVVAESVGQEETDTTTEHIVKAIYNFKGTDADEVCVCVCVCVAVCLKSCVMLCALSLKSMTALFCMLFDATDAFCTVLSEVTSLGTSQSAVINILYLMQGSV